MIDLGELFRVYQTTIGVIGINVLLALSVWLTLYAGQLTLGNAAFMGIGAYASALLGMRAGVPFPIALVLGAVGSMVLAAPLGLAVFRLRGVYLAIATIGFGEVVRVALLATPITGKALGLNGIPPTTANTRICTAFVKPKSDGSMEKLWCADNPPAQPAMSAPATNAASLYRRTAMPWLAAAISSSRIAAHARPTVEPCTRQSTYATTATER